MKSTGMREAYRMAILARALDMKVMIGCMTETSCAISAAAQLSPLAHWADPTRTAGFYQYTSH